MNAILPAPLAVAAAYLLGAIPFGYLTARWARGIDIRAVGSGNIGATNVGRTLGFRFFLLVLAFDLLKGFLPTYFFPRLVAEATGRSLPALGVLVALATILGHNFPVYLGFQGGKGVATSLGALFALDAIASAAAAVGFLASLVITRYVSLSSLLGGLAFAAAHFARVDHPASRDQRAMSLLTIGLLGLLVVRHRKNLARIAAGTEPRVAPRKGRPPEPPKGRAAWVVPPVLAVVGAAAALALHAARAPELAVGRARLTEVARVATGHQRAGRLAFADRGKLLAVTCPRYNRVLLYRVTEAEGLEVVRNVALRGRPVAVAAARERFYVLQRPIADAHHLEPAYWETFDFRGAPVGSKFRVGFDPDDLVITPDARHALVLLSGRAEGEANRPDPALEVVALDGAGAPRVVGHLTFDRPGDDPDRLTFSASGRRAAVSLLGSNEVAAIDLADPAKPRLLGRSRLPEAAVLAPSPSAGDAIAMPVAPEGEAVPVRLPSRRACLACTLPHGSALALYDLATRRPLGRLPLRGGLLRLSPTRPTGIAFAPERGLLAVANRSGGVHLIGVRLGPDSESSGVASSRSTPTPRGG
ncbi:MAG: glycerol-3-phosphate 1-O-acyltransferase PlsY [Planctomycetaceae bacterium]